jgi:drug/metabolite transporter (DMT)-like permease
MKISPGLAYILLVLVASSWAGGIVAGRAIFEEIPPMGLTFWRWFVAAMLMLPFVWRRWRRDAAIVRAAAKPIFILGALVIGATGLTLSSVNFTTATNASLVNGAQPVASILIAWLVYRDKLSLRQGLGVFAAAAGILITITRADLAVLFGLQFNIGDILMVVAILGYGMYANYIRNLPGEVDLYVGFVAISFAGCLILLPFYIAEIILVGPGTLSLKGAAIILFLALYPTIFAMVSWNAALASVGVARAAIFIALVPIFGAGLAIPLLGEQLFLFHVVGTAFVCVGIGLVVLQRKNRDSTSPS